MLLFGALVTGGRLGKKFKFLFEVYTVWYEILHDAGDFILFSWYRIIAVILGTGFVHILAGWAKHRGSRNLMK